MNITTDTAEEVWHDLKTPGAYEWWYFDAEDKENGISFVIIWFAGFPFSPYYNDRHDRWKRTGGSPSPLPADFSGFSFQLYEQGRETLNFIREGPNGLFESRRPDIGVKFEKNSFAYDPVANAYRLDIDFTFPARRKEVKASLVFNTSRRYTYEKKAEACCASRPLHQWLLSVPKADVEGTIEIRETRTSAVQRYTVKGAGYHDHNVGIMPLQEYISRWYWGRAFSGHSDVIYYLIYFRDKTIEPLTLLFLYDHREGKTRVHDRVAIEERSYRRGLFAPLHGREFSLSCDDIRLTVRHERVLDAGPFYLRFLSAVELETHGVRCEPFGGISEYLDPGRLSSRLMRFFTRSRIWRDGERSLMYDVYNNFKRSLNLKKR
jgi:carotenoid 1,2-hydratase